MSSFRITQRTVSTTMLSGLQMNLSRMQKIQEQLSTGRQVNRPSDSPVKTVEALQFRSSIKATQQYVRNADDGLARLGTADAALTDGLDMVGRARVLVLQGLDDTNNGQGRAALAGEIRTLRDGLIGVANTRYLDRPVFAGNKLTPDAFDRVTGQYVGETRTAADPATVGQVLRTVAPGTDVQVNVLGTTVFGENASADQLFAVLDEVASALETDDAAARHTRLGTGLTGLDRAMDRVVAALGEIGARVNRLETVRATSETELDGLSRSLSEAESVDLPKTIVELQMQEVAYKAALGATARAIQPSLLDFLR